MFTSEPGDTTLAVDATIQFRCAAHVSELYSDLTLTWLDVNSGTSPSEDDGFLFYDETLAAGGIVFVTSVLAFSGSTQPVDYALSCTASVMDFHVTKSFFLTVTNETGIPT